jgi:hypothetical protein
MAACGDGNREAAAFPRGRPETGSPLFLRRHMPPAGAESRNRVGIQKARNWIPHVLALADPGGRCRRAAAPLQEERLATPLP